MFWCPDATWTEMKTLKQASTLCGSDATSYMFDFLSWFRFLLFCWKCIMQMTFWCGSMFFVWSGWFLGKGAHYIAKMMLPLACQPANALHMYHCRRDGLVQITLCAFSKTYDLYDSHTNHAFKCLGIFNNSYWLRRGAKINQPMGQAINWR